MKVYNACQKIEEEYFVILVGLHADSPGAAKVANAGSANANFCCKWCVLQSVPIPNKNPNSKKTTTPYPGGYVKATTITRYALMEDHVPCTHKKDGPGIRYVHAG